MPATIIGTMLSGQFLFGYIKRYGMSDEDMTIKLTIPIRIRIKPATIIFFSREEKDLTASME